MNLDTKHRLIAGRTVCGPELYLEKGGTCF